MNRPLPPLTAEEWARVQELFFVLADRPPAAQQETLAGLAASEASIATHVRAMLEVDAAASSLLDEGVGRLVEDVLFDDAPEPPPQRFGPYRIIRELGRGGMGVVLLAHHDEIDAPVAIKILADAWIDPARRELFVAETQTLATLSHPSIARLLHADQLPNGTPWFAMEYVEGEPITHWVWQRRLPLRETLRLFDGLCAAVQHAHRHPVIHRDLKPSNVLVTADGSVKLLDFGIAKRFRERTGPDLPSRTTTYQMTAAYAAPEQFRGEVASVAADVYALGVILFELLVGRRPYDVTNVPIADYEKVIREAYPPHLARALRATAATNARPASTDEEGGASETTHASPRVTPVAVRPSAAEIRDLDALLGAAMAPDVGDRYGSVEALRADMHRFLHQQPLLARKAGWSYHARKFVRRRWREVAAAAALVIAAAAGLLMHNRALAAARDVAIAEAARTNRIRRYLEDLFQGGAQTGTPDSIRAATLVENGIREARALSTDPAMQVDLLGTLGIMSERLGNFARADSLYLLASAGAAQLHGDDHPETLRTRVRRSRLLIQRNQPDSADQQLRELEVRARRHTATGHPVVAEVSAALGTLLRTRAQNEEAIEWLGRAVEQRRQHDPSSREYADAVRELGIAVAGVGDYERADSLFRTALPLVRQRFGPRHPDVAFLLANLGHTASIRGHLDEAEAWQREGVDILAAWYGDNHYLTASIQQVLAQTLIRLERFDEAIPLLRSTIEVFSRAPELGPASAETSITRSTLAIALSGQGNHDEAVAENERALEGLRATLGDQNPNTITVAANLATEVLRAGHPDSSIAILRSLVDGAVEAWGESHRIVAATRIKLGESLAANREYAEAVEVTTAGLEVLDPALGPLAPTTRLARNTLLQAYVALGDSARAETIRRELADTAQSHPSGRQP